MQYFNGDNLYLRPRSFGIGTFERTQAASSLSSEGPTNLASPLGNSSIFWCLKYNQDFTYYIWCLLVDFWQYLRKYLSVSCITCLFLIMLLAIWCCVAIKQSCFDCSTGIWAAGRYDSILYSSRNLVSLPNPGYDALHSCLLMFL